MRRLSFESARCLGCRSCELACVVAHSQSGRLETALSETPVPRRRVAITRGEDGIEALRCKQCDEPFCVFACKSGALARDPATGELRFDEDRCVGCAMCLMVCPFGPRLDPDRDRIVRCDACAGRETPACVAACPTHALGFDEQEPARVTTGFRGRLVVVGSSAAGIAACEAARESAPGCSITLLTADSRPRYSRPLLTYALAGRVDAASLDWRTADHLEALGVQVVPGARAVALRTDARVVVLDDGREIEYDALVIATGARAKGLRVPGEDLIGVHSLRSVEDLEGISRLAQPDRRAVVLGGGNVGLQTSEALIKRGLQVAVVFRSAHLLSQMVDAEAGRRTAALFSRHQVVLRPGRDAAEIVGADSPEGRRVSGVRLDDGELLPADLVVVGKGICPNVEWLAGSGVLVRKGVVTDRCGRTNVTSVFAAGDCAETLDALTGASDVSGIWPVAYETGRAAGSAAVGLDRPSAGPLRLNASRFFGRPIISIGEVREDRLPGARVEVLEDTAEVYRKLVHRGEHLVGALLYGDISNAGRLYRLYRDGAARRGGAE